MSNEGAVFHRCTVTLQFGSIVVVQTSKAIVGKTTLLEFPDSFRWLIGTDGPSMQATLITLVYSSSTSRKRVPSTALPIGG